MDQEILVLICTWIRLKGSWPSIRRTNNRICNPRFPALLTAVMKWLKVVAQGMEDSDDEEEGGWWLGGPLTPWQGTGMESWKNRSMRIMDLQLFNRRIFRFFFGMRSRCGTTSSKIGSIFNVQVNNGELVSSPRIAIAMQNHRFE